MASLDNIKQLSMNIRIENLPHYTTIDTRPFETFKNEGNRYQNVEGIHVHYLSHCV